MEVQLPENVGDDIGLHPMIMDAVEYITGGNRLSGQPLFREDQGFIVA